MSADPAWRDVGLDLVLSRLEEVCPGLPLGIERACTVVGRAGEAGARRPLPSSAARLRIGSATVWVPAPYLPAAAACGQGPVYLRGGARYVMPTGRLCRGKGQRVDSHAAGQISADLPTAPGDGQTRSRGARLAEQGVWAAWAHGVVRSRFSRNTVARRRKSQLPGNLGLLRTQTPGRPRWAAKASRSGRPSGSSATAPCPPGTATGCSTSCSCSNTLSLESTCCKSCTTPAASTPGAAP